MSKESGYPKFEEGSNRNAPESVQLGEELVMPFKVNPDDLDAFERPGFKGFIQVSLERDLGFSALTIWANGEHPKKRMLEGTRIYYVADSVPNGTFTIGDVSHNVKEGDLFVIPQGGEYSYAGEMTLFEVNIPSEEGIIEDEKVEFNPLSAADRSDLNRFKSWLNEGSPKLDWAENGNEAGRLLLVDSKRKGSWLIPLRGSITVVNRFDQEDMTKFSPRIVVNSRFKFQPVGHDNPEVIEVSWHGNDDEIRYAEVSNDDELQFIPDGHNIY